MNNTENILKDNFSKIKYRKKVGTLVFNRVLDSRVISTCDICQRTDNWSTGTWQNASKKNLRCKDCFPRGYKSFSKEEKEKRRLKIHSGTRLIRQEAFIKKCVSVFGEDLYNYSKVYYTSTEDKVEIICKRCNNSWMSRPRVHYTGKGCPSCSSSGFKESKIAYLYVLSCGDYITKIGISNNNPNFRSRKISADTGEIFKVEATYKLNGKSAADTEKKLLRMLREKYLNTSIIFAGYKETFISVNRKWLFDTIDCILNEETLNV